MNRRNGNWLALSINQLTATAVTDLAALSGYRSIKCVQECARSRPVRAGDLSNFYDGRSAQVRDLVMDCGQSCRLGSDILFLDQALQKPVIKNWWACPRLVRQPREKIVLNAI
jgi:hypothetical protein